MYRQCVIFDKRRTYTSSHVVALAQGAKDIAGEIGGRDVGQGLLNDAAEHVAHSIDITAYSGYKAG